MQFQGEFKHNFCHAPYHHEGCNDLSVGYDYDSSSCTTRPGLPATLPTRSSQEGWSQDWPAQATEPRRMWKVLVEYYGCAPQTTADSSIHLDENTEDCALTSWKKLLREEKLLRWDGAKAQDDCATTCCGEFNRKGK